jgi:uncharacterized membrane protein
MGIVEGSSQAAAVGVVDVSLTSRMNRNEILHSISIISVIVIVIINIFQADRDGMGGIDFVFQCRSAGVGLYHR